MKLPLLFLLALLVSLKAHAFDEFIFGSKYDYFKLEKRGSSYYLNDQKVRLGTFSEFLPLFTQEIGDDCPNLPKRPDVSVRAIKGDNKVRRHFFIAQKVVKAGRQCLALDGDAMNYLPLHRKWFRPNEKGTVHFGSIAIGKRNDQVMFKAKKKKSEWVSDDPDILVNWSFINQVLDSMISYDIDVLLHLSAANNKPSFVIQTGNKEYRFYKIAENLWAVKKPKAGWLEGSEKWSFWLDMRKEDYGEKHSGSLQKITNNTLDLESRQAALADVRNTWSMAIQNTLHKALLDPDTPDAFKLSIIAVMRRKPNKENMGAFMKALEMESSPELEQNLTQALRVRNPEGEVIYLDTEATKRDQILRDWKAWWSKFEQSQ